MDLFADDEFVEDEVDGDDEIFVALPPEEFLKHPRDMSFLMGHHDIEKSLLDVFKKEKLPHGLIFSGPQGCGKSTFAYRLARFLLKHGNDSAQAGLFGDAPDYSSLDVAEHDDVFRLIASGGHPDLFTVERQYDATKNKYKDAVDVDEIRKIAPFLRKTASYGGWRVVIVDDADTMTRSAQNAILKILEEPPKKALIVLIAHNIGSLIPTIRSRTQVIHFQRLPDDVMRELLVKGGHGNIESLVELSEGSMSRALEYSAGDIDGVLEVLVHARAKGLEWAEIHRIAEQMGGKGQDEAFGIFERLSLWMFEQGAKTRARGTELPGILAQERERFSQLSLEQILKICDKLGEHFTKTRAANLDKKQAVFQAFAIMAG